MGGSRVSPTDGGEVNRSFPFWWVFFSRFFLFFLSVDQICLISDGIFCIRLIKSSKQIRPVRHSQDFFFLFPFLSA